MPFSFFSKVYDWGGWGTWSRCSEACGKGVEIRHHRCIVTRFVVKGCFEAPSTRCATEGGHRPALDPIMQTRSRACLATQRA